MCGRAAQTLSAVQAAATVFRVIGNVNDHKNSHYHRDGLTATTTSGTTSTHTVNRDVVHHEHNNNNNNNNNNDNNIDDTSYTSPMNASTGTNTNGDRNNYNMSPGMDAIVFWVDHTKDTTTTSTSSSNEKYPKIQMKRMTWGLLSQNGTTSKPLEKGMNKHFTNLMYNARSDTLYEKVTFHNLCSKKQSCIIALDGYFEWKTEMGQKQPYFVYRNSKNTTGGTHGDNQQQQQQNSYLLLAGLWKRTMTGWSDQPIIDTFTMLTTEVCPAIQWLHTRMPVLIWDDQFAVQWLNNPASKFVHEQLVQQSQKTTCDQLQWHKVTTAMSSMKFRTIEAILPYKDKQLSVKSFFTKSVPSSTTKTKDESDDEVVIVSQDQINNNNTVENMTETTEQRQIILDHETSLLSPIQTGTKRKVGDTTTKSPMKKQSTPAKSRFTNTNTRTIDSFFTPKSTRK
jgi:putative SOS response-associated peptidase YedK